MQKVHFRLTSVAQKRCCLSSLTTTSKNNRFYEQNNSSAHASRFLLHFFDVHYTTTKWIRTWTYEDKCSFSLFFSPYKFNCRKNRLHLTKLSGYNSRALAAVCRQFFSLYLVRRFKQISTKNIHPKCFSCSIANLTWSEDIFVQFHC